MKLREAFELASAEAHRGQDVYQRVFELMHGRAPSADERDMIKRRCLWYETDRPRTAAA